MRIVCPFENMTKEEIVKVNKDLFKDLTGYWCDAGTKEPCKKCHSCQAMIEAKLL